MQGISMRGPFSSRGVHESQTTAYSETFEHPDVAVGGATRYSEVAAVR